MNQNATNMSNRMVALEENQATAHRDMMKFLKDMREEQRARPVPAPAPALASTARPQRAAKRSASEEPSDNGRVRSRSAGGTRLRTGVGA